MNKLDQQKGITLIALVITIIILLIMAGISIAMISGNNGILSKTGEAITKQQLGTAQDKCVLIASDKLAEYYYDIYVNVSSEKKQEYNKTKLDNLIVESIIKDTKNVKEISDLGVTPEGNDEEEDGLRTRFTLTYSDGTNIEGTVDNGKIIWGEYARKDNPDIDDPSVINAEKISLNAEKFYGAKVLNYGENTPAKDLEWRIFHSDGKNMYLIMDKFATYDICPDGKDGSKVIEYPTLGIPYWTPKCSMFSEVKNDYEGTAWIFENSKASELIKDLEGKDITTDAAKTTAYLLDTNVWSKFADKNAEYAIGSPTIELFCDAYKVVHPDEYITYIVKTQGYKVRVNGSYEGILGIGKEDITSNNNIFAYPFDVNNPDLEIAHGMWIASPTEDTSNALMESGETLAGIGIAYTAIDGSDGHGPRSNRIVVKLKETVKLIDNEDGTFSIK